MATQPSRLLALPREIRDIIYEYALTEVDGLVIIETSNQKTSTSKFKLCYGDEKYEEANQMKFACRQLHVETRGLGLKLNKLRFMSNCHMMSFRRFLSTCSIKQQQSLRRITLSFRYGYLRTHYALITTIRPNLLAFCTANPQCEMIIRLKSYYTSKSLLKKIIYGSQLQYLLHQTCSEIFPAAHYRPFIDSMSHHVINCPTNLKVYPATSPGWRQIPYCHNPEDMAASQRMREHSIQYEKWCREGF